MTYCFSVTNDVVLGAIHTIPEWISSFIYFSVFVDVIPKWHFVLMDTSHSTMSSFWFSIQMKFLIWYDISFWYQCKLKQTFFQFENHKSCSLVQVAHAYLIWHENHVSKNSLSWASQFYHVNAVWTLLWNKTHSGMKSIQYHIQYHINRPLELILTLVLARLHVGASLLLISSFPWTSFD